MSMRTHSGSPALTAYANASVRSASPAQLVVALYDAAIAAAAKAAAADESGNLETRGLQIDRAQAIVSELIASVNPAVGSPIPSSLLSIYHYMSRRLVDATTEAGPAALVEIAGLLRQLRSAWDQAERGSQ